MNAPPLAEWEDEDALRAVVFIAAGLPCHDFGRDVAPLLRRLTTAQRALLARAMSDPGFTIRG